ncbi:g959 [Coccomyxa elongata]
MSCMQGVHEPCHPRIRKPDCTCYSLEQLKKIADALRSEGHTIAASHDKQKLWRAIDAIARQHYGSLKDWAWKDIRPVKRLNDAELMHMTFRPRAPKDWMLHVQKEGGSDQGRYIWLSNFDIDAVMAQYEQLEDHSGFKFFKSVPIDFEKIGDPLSKLNIIELRSRGITSFGVIFNLDTHDLPGSHWVAVFGDSSTGLLAFFDSYGKPPEREIQEFMAKIVVQGLYGYDGRKLREEERIEMTPVWNRTRHQFQGFACGLYSLYCIITLLGSDRSLRAFNRHCCQRIDDRTMNEFRRAWYIDAGK